ncbi:MAG: phosphoribosyl-ATP diphosphatase [Gammaproteobacteria bacterium RIFCSPLOWO2_02_FULL_56_15]|nr:MAG: phosphoribosyl-ATP diphosphatase [Gammaproteobacteria bacterium RIFCSPLOWO2_02_FULL_56_15]
MSDILTELSQVIDSRKTASPAESYVASLFHLGTDGILKKIGEEATEVIMAGKGTDRATVIHEVADLWFHTLILLSSLDLGPAEVLAELESRHGISGLAEKASRKK